MVKLLIIADDFTGALDTGIQFAKRGIRTQVFTKLCLEDEEIKPDTEVLVVDAESRPVPKEAAYGAVNCIARWAAARGIGIVFKKTDSALRGNIGSELQAVADMNPEETLFFFPGHPDTERITKDGVQYISGELLENSVFGNDPFEPVKRSYIPDIIKEQSDIEVSCIKSKEPVPQKMAGQPDIVVCDVINIEDIDKRLEELVYEDRLKLVAGCAALADRLAETIFFCHTEKKHFQKTEGIYVACGSLNKITQEQVEYAEKECGFLRRHLTMEQKLMLEYYETPEGKQFLEEIVTLCRMEKKVIVDSFDMDEDKESFLNAHGIAPDNVRRLISEAHGRIVKEIADQHMDMTILMTGGDTLMGYMKLTGCSQIEPICEIEQGVVVSVLEWDGHRQQVISKSGGFGTKDILCRIAQKIIKQNNII